MPLGGSRPRHQKLLFVASIQPAEEKWSILLCASDIRREQQMDILAFFNRLLCQFGLHDYKLIDATFGFGEGGSVGRDQCRRCGKIRMRRI